MSQVPGPSEVCRDWLRALAGVVLGATTAPLDLALAAVAVPLADRNRRIAAGTTALTVLELRRVTRFHGREHTDPIVPAVAARYLAVRSAAGMLGGGVVVLLAAFVLTGVAMVTAWVADGGWSPISDGGRVGTGLLATAAVPGAVLVFLAVVGVSGVGRLDRWLVVRMLGRRTEQALASRIDELTRTRAHVLDAVDDERRRIERDIHDGVQQRLVAVGMLLGRARRADRPERLAELVARAHDEVRGTVGELREVAHRIRPAELDRGGLAAALESLAGRAGLPVALDVRPTGPVRPAVETVLYFAVSEAVANAVKHAGARAVRVDVGPQPFERVRAVVTDDGCGGADPAGTGLSGLARRVAAVDGELDVHSPPGGPTVLTVSVPCG